MFSLGNPYYLLILIIIPIIYFWNNKFAEKNEGTFLISSAKLFSDKIKRKGLIRKNILLIFQYLTLILIVIALSRPRIIDSLKETKMDVIDIVLVMDISSSMLATDFSPNRLEAVKKTAKDFIEERISDRIGVLVFAGESFIQCPLTVDKDVLLSLMDDIQVAEQS